MKRLILIFLLSIILAALAAHAQLPMHPLPLGARTAGPNGGIIQFGVPGGLYINQAAAVQYGVPGGIYFND